MSNHLAEDLHWSRSPLAAAFRAMLQRVLLFPVLNTFCRPRHVRGADGFGRGPVVFVANHASHADTALILRALPASVRRRTAPAAAQDYFFRGPLRSVFFRILVGAFPFPRKGTDGLDRARRLLRSGRSVILFPEGTRSTDGRLGRFRCGVAALASEGAVVVPVGIAGQERVLPKGSNRPRRAPVALAFGAPMRFEADQEPRAIARGLQDVTAELVEQARLDLLRPRPRLFDHFRTVATSRRGLTITFLWGIAEAVYFPVVPDFVIAPLALAAPGRAALLVLAAAAGSAIGGGVAYAIGGLKDVVHHLPLVTDPMASSALEWMKELGSPAFYRQPLSGIPFKAFAYQAHGAGIGIGDVFVHGTIARGLRFAAVGGFFAVAGRILRPWVPRLYAPFLVLYVVAFTAGLIVTLFAWTAWG